MGDGNRIELVWEDNRKPGYPEWSAPCGCVFHVKSHGVNLPHWHQCELHAGAAALKEQVAEAERQRDLVSGALTDLGERLADANVERDKAHAEVGRLRAALERGLKRHPIGKHEAGCYRLEAGTARTTEKDCTCWVKQAEAALAPASEPCAKCKGEGVVHLLQPRREGPPRPHTELCPTCHGTRVKAPGASA